MDRSLYPNDVEVSSVDLSNTENTKIFQILRRYLDSNQFGVRTGFLVTVNSVSPTLVDITPGTGYTRIGEYIELSTSQLGLSLVDYTNGALNYVVAVYEETNIRNQPQQSNPGFVVATQAIRSIRIEVLSEDQFNALSESNTSPTTTTQNNILILGIVRASGPNVNLSDTAIILPTQLNGGVAASLQSSNITGITLVRVSDTTPTGIGTLFYTNATNTLSYQAPGDSSPGPAIDVSLGGFVSLLSSGAGKTIRVSVISALLPTTDVQDNVSITNIYTQTVPSHSAEDLLHRSFVGSGIPTPNNPHGITASDLGIGETATEFHQRTFHSAGFTKTSEPSTAAEPSINTAGIPHRFQITQLAALDNVVIDGFIHGTVNVTEIQFSDVTIDRSELYEFFLVSGSGTGVAALERRLRMSIPGPPDTLFDFIQLASTNIENSQAESGSLDYNSSTKSFTFTADGDSTGPLTPVPNFSDDQSDRFIRLYSGDLVRYLDLYVRNDTGGTTWTTPSVTKIVQFEVSLTEIEKRLRTKIASVPFTGSATGFLGFGFGVARSPNLVRDERQFGNISSDDIQSEIFENLLAGIPTRKNGTHFRLIPTEVFPTVPPVDPGPFDGAFLMYRNSVGTITLFVYQNGAWQTVT